ncbi:MAG: MerR family DNA-binding transcriptional regulator, partial [Paracoccaceae bacterium]
MKILDIGELSEAARLPASALRYYEELGLIQSIGRHGLRRQFGPE